MLDNSYERVGKSVVNCISLRSRWIKIEKVQEDMIVMFWSRWVGINVGTVETTLA